METKIKTFNFGEISKKFFTKPSKPGCETINPGLFISFQAPYRVISRREHIIEVVERMDLGSTAKHYIIQQLGKL